MILADKITMLRKKMGWSQEDLAMKLNVSRQSVSKWESTASVPDLDKIIKLSQIFEVSTDYLLKDDLEETEPLSEREDIYIEEQILSLSLEEANGYMDLKKNIAKKIALAISSFILSPIPLILLAQWAHAGRISVTEDVGAAIGIAILLVIVCIGTGVLILQGMQEEKYEYIEKENFNLQYGIAGIAEKRKELFEPTRRMCIAVGVGLCILSPVAVIITGAFNFSENIIVSCIALLLLMVAIGVYLFVWSSIIYESYNAILQVGEYTRARKAEEKRTSLLSGIYWCAITAIYLGYSFITMKWETSWIIWPVAGVLYAGIRGIEAMVYSKKQKDNNGY